MSDPSKLPCGVAVTLCHDVIAQTFAPAEPSRELMCEREKHGGGPHRAEGWEWRNGQIWRAAVDANEIDRITDRIIARVGPALGIFGELVGARRRDEIRAGVALVLEEQRSSTPASSE